MVAAVPNLKITATPPQTLVVKDSHILKFEDALWRIYRSKSRHRPRWDELRTFGPVPGMRFDPHPTPQGDHPGFGAMYAACDPVTAFAEVFYRTRVIDRVDEVPVLVGWRPVRPLTLLDLTGTWPIANLAAASLQMIDDKNLTRLWARKIFSQLGSDFDGLYHHSAVDSKPLVTLFDRARRKPSFPDWPEFSAALTDDSAAALVEDARATLNYDVI